MKIPAIMVVCLNCKVKHQVTAYVYEHISLRVLDGEIERFNHKQRSNLKTECQKFHLILTIEYVKANSQND